MVSGYQAELDPEDAVSDIENVILTGDIVVKPLKKPLESGNIDEKELKEIKEKVEPSPGFKLVPDKPQTNEVDSVKERKHSKKDTSKSKKSKKKSKKKSVNTDDEEDDDRKKLEEFLGSESDIKIANRASEEYESL